MIKNRLNLMNIAALAEAEESFGKRRALALFDSGRINDLAVGTFAGLAAIHQALFQDVYDFAGKLRQENIAKGHFRFAPVLYLREALRAVDELPQSTFDEILHKYVEMNVVHPFREGNGRSSRIWLDQMLKHELNLVVDWSKISKEDYLIAMERSPVKDAELKGLIQSALSKEVKSRAIFMKGLDQSYAYEGYETYQAHELLPIEDEK